MTQAQPLIQTLPMTLGAPMSDDPSNPTAIEIPLQIELPNGQTLFAAVALGGLPFDGQRQIAERMAAAWNAFTGVTTEEIKAPVKCLHQIAEPAAAPQAVQPAVPYGWNLVPVDPTREMRSAGRVAIHTNRDSSSAGQAICVFDAMLAAAPAHPAEGVPAAKNGRQVLVDSGALQMVLNALERDALEGKHVRAEMRLELMQSITHPAAQGLDARDAAFEAVRKAFCKLQRYSFFLDSRNNVRRCADHCGNWVEFEAVHTLFEPQSVDAALAAQAKQGGV